MGTGGKTILKSAFGKQYLDWVQLRACMPARLLRDPVTNVRIQYMQLMSIRHVTTKFSKMSSYGLRTTALHNPHLPTQTPESFSYKRISQDLNPFRVQGSIHAVMWKEHALVVGHDCRPAARRLWWEVSDGFLWELRGSVNTYRSLVSQAPRHLSSLLEPLERYQLFHL
jgi:hypothetical protein